ncbi:hypothetical protein E4U61_004769 [Claviceps capensis]|nr:hypothetical protein E4U61_004769 [Claviceps capensis]
MPQKDQFHEDWGLQLHALMATTNDELSKASLESGVWTTKPRANASASIRALLYGS